MMSERPKRTVRFVVDGPARRLEAVVANELPHLSRRHVRALIASGEVRLNQRRTRKGETVRTGDRFTVPEDVAKIRSLRPEPDLEIEVLRADASIVVIDKPSGVPAVAQRPQDTGTVANFLLARFPETATLGGPPLEAGVVHRLDTATSGVLLGARTADALGSLRAQFRAHTIEKTYHAIVWGRVDRSAAISVALRNRPGDPSRVEPCDTDAPRARPATTRIEPLVATDRSTLLRIRIDTGVRHQIRAHLAHRGHPLVGDDDYDVRPENAGIRLMLHASEIAFRHPTEEATTRVQASYPQDFSRELARQGFDLSRSAI